MNVRLVFHCALVIGQTPGAGQHMRWCDEAHEQVMTRLPAYSAHPMPGQKWSQTWGTERIEKDSLQHIHALMLDK